MLRSKGGKSDPFLKKPESAGKERKERIFFVKQHKGDVLVKQRAVLLSIHCGP